MITALLTEEWTESSKPTVLQMFIKSIIKRYLIFMELYVLVSHCFGRLDWQAPHVPKQFLIRLLKELPDQDVH